VTRALVISPRDNVATALEMLEPGASLALEGRVVAVRDRIPPGHKVAVDAIAAGQAVMKYGSAIGTAIVDIAVGAHVHTHNVASSRGRGDLAVRPDDNRLAEPVDSQVTLPGSEQGRTGVRPGSE
jgi:altronate dehydratase